MTTVFVCHHDLAGYGSAIILPINYVFLELVLTGQLMKQSVVTPIQDAGQSTEISRTVFWTHFVAAAAKVSIQKTGMVCTVFRSHLACRFCLLWLEKALGARGQSCCSPSTQESVFQTGLQDVRRVTNPCVNDKIPSTLRPGFYTPHVQTEHSQSTGWI